jgi:hypothetical protein
MDLQRISSEHGQSMLVGYFAFVAFLLIAARRAGIASSHFEFTAALFPLSNPWSPV